MKNKILELAKSAGWLVLIFIIGVIGFRISFSLGTLHKKEEFNIKIFTKNGYYDDSPKVEKEIESISIGKPKRGLCPGKWLDHEFFIIKFK